MTHAPYGAALNSEVKSCCAAAYDNDLVAAVLGASYHPGGASLTRRLAAGLDLRGGQRVLDVASGPGDTALLLAREYGVTVDGVDLGQRSVARARAAADEAGLAERVRFRIGDAERLPVADGAVDAVMCECAFCTFPDKATAAAELARVLAPGGRVGITDVTLRAEGLPAELDSLAGWVACLADARPLRAYADILTGAGLRVIRTERHDDALAAMIDQIEARLAVARMVASRRLALAGLDWDRVRQLTALAKRAITDGAAGYALLVAEKPTTAAA